MKQFLLAVLVCAGAWCLAGCNQDAQPDDGAAESSAAETTAAVTTVTTVTTAAETTTVTTTTQAQYLLAEDAALEIDLSSVRATGCKFTVVNHGEANQPYSKCWRLVDPETDKELPQLSDAELSDAAAGVLPPEGSTEITAEWEERYGPLNDGVYLLELVLEQVAEEQSEESSGAEARKIPKVARAELEIDSGGFVPRVSIDPATVTPEGCTLTVRNSPDIGRTYTLVYRLYDETGAKRVELLREYDKETKLANDYHLEPGEVKQMKYSWRETYGALLEGKYAVEIDLMPDDGSPTMSYTAQFEIKE